MLLDGILSWISIEYLFFVQDSFRVFTWKALLDKLLFDNYSDYI